MEDLAPRSPHINSMMDDDDVSIAKAVLDTLAKLHARFWMSPRFQNDLAWVQTQVEGPLETLFDGFVREHIVKELAREKFKREFAQELGATAAELYAGMKAVKRHQARLPQTLLHGDAHFGNTYVLPDGTGGLLDWQVSARGFLMHDVGYLIPTALSVESRRWRTSGSCFRIIGIGCVPTESMTRRIWRRSGSNTGVRCSTASTWVG
jgi:Ser/Thr protein kinase RdoA (MazF antagonist)